MRVRLYLDEDVDVALAAALRRRGVDALTTQEAGNVQQRDEAQLAFAAQHTPRVLHPQQQGFRPLASRDDARGADARRHGSLHQLPLGVLLRRLSRLSFELTQEEMANRLEFLGSWR